MPYYQPVSLRDGAAAARKTTSVDSERADVDKVKPRSSGKRVDRSLGPTNQERDVSGGPTRGPIRLTPNSFAGKMIYVRSITTVNALLD
jgi:hypothetical protein